MYFTDLELNEDLLDALYDMHFDECTPIQEQCIPHILEGRDLIGIAQTGTGKTAAYLLPLLTLLRRDPHPADAVNCLIMAPTRELARQIDQALQGFGYYLDINGVAVYGGNDGIRYEQERKSLTSGADIVIATPGRLITHMQLGALDLSRTTHLVLDEADRMLDMGFSEDILKIVEQLPKQRQTILFSATMPDKITSLARDIMNDPVEVRIAVSKPAEKIEQSVYLCKEGDKVGIIKHLFSERKPERVILFASSKQKVKDLNIVLKRKGYNVAAMHSDLEQKQREEVMLDFKAGRIDVLVATDIVARGIDIDDITLVINYDVPRDAEDYVHRIGRTARAGRDGRAVTLVSERDGMALSSIERLLEAKIPRAELPEGFEKPEISSSRSRSGSKNGKSRKANGGRSRDGKKKRSKQSPQAQGDVKEAGLSAKKSEDETSKEEPSQKKDSRRHRRNHKRRRGGGHKEGSMPSATGEANGAGTD